ncbi:hypothetical protein C8J56DRAFT_1157227 [Mycena floridula]|nr:hypothetical protein C8J56DRAFT_1157227 [Mycena floridula]
MAYRCSSISTSRSVPTYILEPCSLHVDPPSSILNITADLENVIKDDTIALPDLEKYGPSQLKLSDSNGLPLIPQPLSDLNDPLNWSFPKKIMVLVIMAVLAFFAVFGSSMTPPAYAQVGVSLGVSVVQASYIGTTAIAGAGNGYLRRIRLQFCRLQEVRHYLAPFLILFIGMGQGAAFAQYKKVHKQLGDIFCLHERGKMIGIATAALANGPHVAPFPAAGGFAAQFISWRWTIIIPSIIHSVLLVVLVIGLPETLFYQADPNARYPSIVACALFSGHVLFWECYARTNSFRLNTSIGGVLGEFVAGLVTDRLILATRRQNQGRVKLEARLHALWTGFFLLPLGLVGAYFAIAITSFASQVLFTPVIAYVVDCYKGQAVYAIQIVTFTRMAIAC